MGLCKMTFCVLLRYVEAIKNPRCVRLRYIMVPLQSLADLVVKDTERVVCMKL